MSRVVLLVLALTVMFIVASGRLISAQGEATPAAGFVAPDPSECSVEPRSAHEFLSVFTTPIAEHPEPEDTELQGEPVDEATLRDVEATVHLLFACVNAGDPLRVVALFTDRALRTLFANEQIAPDQVAGARGGTPEAIPEADRVQVRVLEARNLPDGRVVVVVEERIAEGAVEETLVLIREGDRFLVDEAVGMRTISIASSTPTP